MNIPNFSQEQVVTKELYLTRPWQTFMDNLLQNLRYGLGRYGFQITNVSSDPNSVSPPQPGGQLAIVQSTFGQANGAVLGSIVFDPAVINGGSVSQPNGQLKVLLGDGIFHAIPNL